MAIVGEKELGLHALFAFKTCMYHIVLYLVGGLDPSENYESQLG